MSSVKPLHAVDWLLGEVSSFELEENTVCPTEAIEAYHRDGVVCLRDAFDKTWLETIETGIEQLLRTRRG